MKTTGFLFLLILLIFPHSGISQHCGPTGAPAFIAPDTVCQGYEVVLSNTTPGNTFHWNFSSGNATTPPYGVNIGDPGGYLQTPYYIHTIKDSTLFYSFVSTSQSGEVIRFFHGTSLTGYIDSVTNLGRFGVLNYDIKGLCTGNDNGHWYLFVVDKSTVLRLDFGSSLMNDPVAVPFTFPDLFLSEKICIAKEGDQWIGFITDFTSSKLLRLRFGNSLANVPQIETAGLFLPIAGPVGFDLKQEEGNWYMFIVNQSNRTVSRLDFGNSLLNTPTGEYLSGIVELNQYSDISISLDCGKATGFVTNCVQAGIFLVQLFFDKGLGGPVRSSPLEDIMAVLNKPYGLSPIFREGDTLCMFVVSNGSSIISRMNFKGIDVSSLPTWDGPDPPPITYSAPGNYNIILRVDEGTPNEQVFCKNIVVVPVPDFSLGPNRSICDHDTAWLDAGAGYTSYLWSTGDTTQMLPVTDSGTYWVEVVNSWDCIGTDTVNVSVNETFLSAIDTTICYGLSYWAQGAWQTESGTYVDTLMTVHYCDSILQTNLTTEICALKCWIPTAFTPNGDGLNDVFRPVAENILEYRMMIYDRWGQQLFESTTVTDGWDGTVKGNLCPSEVYSFIIFFQSYDNLGVTEKRTGTVMLVR
ncbi:MAG: gliding motility-associated C-terminal domain-containing protein [Bacteroidales bacterium]|nr:gliding motility-associated C-terminal domain-containing protein [Bacteroidales bacterium]